MNLSNIQGVVLTNVEQVPGKTIVEHYGLVTGNTVRAKHVGRDIAASFKNLVGGELKGYTELLGDAREQATTRMVEQALALGANAVVNVRFSTSAVAQGAAELYVYGTAVRAE
tara:strand:+ start:28 stop:366 length:339 start_codon:yes stop_codon:yes gene_type:complete